MAFYYGVRGDGDISHGEYGISSWYTPSTFNGFEGSVELTESIKDAMPYAGDGFIYKFSVNDESKVLSGNKLTLNRDQVRAIITATAKNLQRYDDLKRTMLNYTVSSPEEMNREIENIMSKSSDLKVIDHIDALSVPGGSNPYFHESKNRLQESLQVALIDQGIDAVESIDERGNRILKVINRDGLSMDEKYFAHVQSNQRREFLLKDEDISYTDILEIVKAATTTTQHEYANNGQELVTYSVGPQQVGFYAYDVTRTYPTENIEDRLTIALVNHDVSFFDLGLTKQELDQLSPSARRLLDDALQQAPVVTSGVSEELDSIPKFWQKSIGDREDKAMTIYQNRDGEKRVYATLESEPQNNWRFTQFDSEGNVILKQSLGHLEKGSQSLSDLSQVLPYSTMTAAYQIQRPSDNIVTLRQQMRPHERAYFDLITGKTPSQSDATQFLAYDAGTTSKEHYMWREKMIDHALPHMHGRALEQLQEKRQALTSHQYTGNMRLLNSETMQMRQAVSIHHEEKTTQQVTQSEENGLSM